MKTDAAISIHYQISIRFNHTALWQASSRDTYTLADIGILSVSEMCGLPIVGRRRYYARDGIIDHFSGRVE